MVNLSTWLQHDARWMTGAACVTRQDLPWVSETAPPPEKQQTMAAICADCKVLKPCATYAITASNIGGFYAGLWMPWPHQGGGRDRELRIIQRRNLRRLLRPPRRRPRPSLF